MRDGQYVRRKSRVRDEVSLVSSDEQARLLNDPAVPLQNMHERREMEHPHSEEQTRANIPERNVQQAVAQIAENEEAA